MKQEITNDISKLIMEGAAWERLGLKKPVFETKDTKKVDEGTKEDKDEGDAPDSCPLCKHELTEEISDEDLMEHVAKILESVEESGILNESEEDEDEADEDEEDFDDEDSEDEDFDDEDLDEEDENSEEE